MFEHVRFVRTTATKYRSNTFIRFQLFKNLFKKHFPIAQLLHFPS